MTLSLDQSVVVERQTRTSDGAGGAAVSWDEVCTIFAHIEATTGGEQTELARVVEKTLYNVTVRTADVQNIVRASDRLNWNGSYLQIRVLPLNVRAAYVTLVCWLGSGR